MVGTHIQVCNCAFSQKLSITCKAWCMYTITSLPSVYAPPTGLPQYSYQMWMVMMEVEGEDCTSCHLQKKTTPMILLCEFSHIQWPDSTSCQIMINAPMIGRNHGFLSQFRERTLFLLQLIGRLLFLALAVRYSPVITWLALQAVCVKGVGHHQVGQW